MKLSAVVADEAAVYAWLNAAERGDASAMKAASSAVPFAGSYSPTPFWGDGRHTTFGTRDPGSRANYEARVNPLHRNAVVAACVGWMVDNFGQARLQVTSENEEGEDEAIPDHPLVKLLKRPNDYYPTRVLFNATVLDWKLCGNAYWYKIPGGAPGGPTVGVKRLAAESTRPVYPRGATTEYITGYETYDGREWHAIPGGREAVVHFRDGVSPDDERLGWRRIGAVLRQVSAHNEGATYTSAIMENMGVSPYLFSGTDKQPLDDQMAEAIERLFHGGAGGQNRGRSIALKWPVLAEKLGMSPQELALDTIMDRPVSEICALLRLSPMVVGFPDDARTYSNMGEARRAAHEDCIIPLQDSIADDLTHQLLPEFGDPDVQAVGWDRSRVQALAEDRTENVNRAVVAFQGGLCTLATAQNMANLPVTDGSEELWYAPSGTPQATDAEEEGAEDAEAEDAAEPDVTDPKGNAVKAFAKSIGVRDEEFARKLMASMESPNNTEATRKLADSIASLSNT